MSAQRTTTARRGKPKNLCGCGSPTRDGAFVCARCIDSIGADLRELLPSDDDPGLWASLESVLAGERGIDYRTLGGSSGGTVATGIVLDETAVKRATRVRRALVRLVIDCQSGNVKRAADAVTTATPDLGSVPSMARWLLWRVDGMAFHPAFTRAARELSRAVDQACFSVMPPPNRQWLGPCGMPDCVGSMFARRDEYFATCSRCDAWVEARERRNWLIAELEDRLCTAAEIADLYDPDPAVRPAIRKRVNQWASRGRLLDPRVFDWDPDAPTCPWPAPRELRFRFGDAFDLLLAHDNDTNPARSTP
jgi:hypothetical protein